MDSDQLAKKPADLDLHSFQNWMYPGTARYMFELMLYVTVKQFSFMSG